VDSSFKKTRESSQLQFARVEKQSSAVEYCGLISYYMSVGFAAPAEALPITRAYIIRF
jgi:hypothetical protein